jgi:outer membrane immunogenic protein
MRLENGVSVMKKVLIAAAGALAFTSLAQAADLPYRKEAPAVYDYAPTFTWTGLYGGLNVGVGFGSYVGGQAFFGKSPAGGLYGFTGGYNYQQGRLIVGGEGDFAMGHIADSAAPIGGVSTGVVRNFFSLRARVGYALADRTLIYGTGGYAGADVRGAVGAPGISLDQSHIANGWALGGGMEYAITPHFSVKGEYMYASMGNNTYFTPPNAVSNGVNLNLVRAGVNYHF